MVNTLPRLLILAPLALQAAPDYPLPPEALAVAAGAPTGRVETLELPASALYPGTRREAWIYLPVQPPPERGYPVMVFQDGGGYQSRNGAWRVPTVLDNLIHRREIPPMVAVFINPGITPAPGDHAQPRFNRSFEYDSADDRYARFLAEEALPAAAKRARLSDHPDDRGLAGASSGGVCAFNAAFRRPDLFRRVFCTIGTFVGLRGGDELSTLVRKVEPLPLRVFLQDGSNDNNLYAGDWWMANQAMQRSLLWAGYDHRHVWGEGGHDSKHGASLFPDALRWLWRDYPQPLRANPDGKSQSLAVRWTVAGEGWKPCPAPAGALRPWPEGLAEIPVLPAGLRAVSHCRSTDRSLLFVAVRGDRHVWSFQLDAAGKPGHGQAYFYAHTDLAGDAGTQGLAVDRDGRLYAATPLGVQIFDQPGRVNAILPLPPGFLPGCIGWSADDPQVLWVASRDGTRAFCRRMAVTGQREGDPALKPEKPRL